MYQNEYARNCHRRKKRKEKLNAWQKEIKNGHIQQSKEQTVYSFQLRFIISDGHVHALKLDESEGDTAEKTDLTWRTVVRSEREREKPESGRREVMVLTADLHAAEGRVRRRLVTLGEGGGSRSSAHPEAFSTTSTFASTPTPQLLRGLRLRCFSFSPAAPAAFSRLGWPVLFRQLSSSSSATV